MVSWLRVGPAPILLIRRPFRPIPTPLPRQRVSSIPFRLRSAGKRSKSEGLSRRPPKPMTVPAKCQGRFKDYDFGLIHIDVITCQTSGQLMDRRASVSFTWQLIAAPASFCCRLQRRECYQRRRLPTQGRTSLSVPYHAHSDRPLIMLRPQTRSRRRARNSRRRTGKKRPARHKPTV